MALGWRSRVIFMLYCDAACGAATGESESPSETIYLAQKNGWACSYDEKFGSQFFCPKHALGRGWAMRTESDGGLFDENRKR